MKTVCSVSSPLGFAASLVEEREYNCLAFPQFLFHDRILVLRRIR